MAKSKAAAGEAAPDTIVVMLANRQRTSLGDYSEPVVELPADEARQLITSGLAVRMQVAS
jgi:hypothetical protein